MSPPSSCSAAYRVAVSLRDAAASVVARICTCCVISSQLSVAVRPTAGQSRRRRRLIHPRCGNLCRGAGSATVMWGQERWRRVADDTVVDDLARAAAGEQASWDRLIDRYGGLVWSVARSYRLSADDAADVSQTTWLRLVEHLGRLREPERLSAWLVTTAKRECLRVIRSRSRDRVLDLERLDRTGSQDPPLDAGLLANERNAQLMAALGRLNDGCQRLLRVLMASPPPSYDLVSEALAMPIGSIGPTRARCLGQLRKHLAELGISPAGGGSV